MKPYRKCHCGAQCDYRDASCAGHVLCRHKEVKIVDGERRVIWAHECDTHAVRVEAGEVAAAAGEELDRRV